MSFNKEISIFDSFTQVAGTTIDSTPLDNSNWAGIRLLLEITANGGAFTLDVKIQELIGSTWTDVVGASFAQKSANGASSLVLYPSITASANVKVSDHLPRKWRVRAVSATNTVTWSLTGVYLPAGA